MKNIESYQTGKDKSILAVSAIHKSRSQLIREKSYLSSFVEKPLLYACEILYDKNIRTWSTSANKKDIGRGAYIILDYDTLSLENKKIAEQCGEVGDYDGGKAIIIKFPMDERTMISEIEAKSMEVVSKFKTQEALWVPHYSFEDLLLFVYLDLENIPKDHECTREDFVKEWDLFYDEKGDKFYYSQEHFDKVNNR